MSSLPVLDGERLGVEVGAHLVDRNSPRPDGNLTSLVREGRRHADQLLEVLDRVTDAALHRLHRLRRRQHQLVSLQHGDEELDVVRPELDLGHVTHLFRRQSTDALADRTIGHLTCDRFRQQT
jgi:hypothetical protein